MAYVAAFQVPTSTRSVFACGTMIFELRSTAVAIVSSCLKVITDSLKYVVNAWFLRLVASASPCAILMVARCRPSACKITEHKRSMR
jgi:hypothetical protein